MAKEEFSSAGEVRTGFIRGTTFAYRPVQYYMIDGQATFEGDIILGTTEQMERLAEEIRNTPTQERGVIISGEQFRWPQGIVPFTIDPSLPDIARVNDAVRHWNERTNIRLIEHTNQSNFVTFRPAGGCSSAVGMQGGQQFINLAPGCDNGSTIHEIGHAVGLWHEQSREDRDLYIRIHWENIEAGKEHNFNQHIVDGDDVGLYDFGSIMHYPTWAFSRNQQPTIETFGGQAIGQRNGLSDGDIAAVNSMYVGTGPSPRLETIRRGSRGDLVVKLQKCLSQLGYDLGPAGVDGIFGPATDAAVRRFQSDKGLQIDGIVGPKTWGAISAQC